MQRPLYRVVIDTIVERIASGELPPGAMLPSESQLGADLGVSQGTARKALMELESRRVLRRVQGRGTFVAVQTPENSLFHFFRLRRPDGTQIRPELSAETVRRRLATAAEAAILHDGPGEVVEIDRVRSHEGQPVVREISVVPGALFPGLPERAPLPNTLYVMFQQAYRCIIVRAEEQIHARPADAHSADLLGVATGTPLLEVERHAIDVLDRTVEIRRSSYLTDPLIYAITLQ